MKNKKNIMIIIIMILTVVLFSKLETVKALEVKGTGKYSEYNFTQVEKGDNGLDVSNYYYYNILNSSHAIGNNCSYCMLKGTGNFSSYADTNTIFFSMTKPDITKTTLNDEEIEFYTHAADTYVPISYLDKEYSILVFSINGEEANKIIVYNKAVTDKKTEALEQTKKYLKENMSDKVKAVITTAQNKINEASTIAEINTILEALPKDIETQEKNEQQAESSKKITPPENKKEDVKNPKTGAFAGFTIILFILGCSLIIYVKKKNTFKNI